MYSWMHKFVIFIALQKENDEISDSSTDHIYGWTKLVVGH